MSKIKNGGLDQYGAEPLEQQQFETAGVEGVKHADRLEIGNSIFCRWPRTSCSLYINVPCQTM